MLKLNPDLVEVNLKLAELHQHLGLMTEAMAFFQVVVAHHERRGDTKATFATLKKMVDLDPENVSSRLKLAELYAREQMGGEALAEFKRRGRLARAQQPPRRAAARRWSASPRSSRTTSSSPGAWPTTTSPAGDHKRALAKLQLCFKADPRDIPTLILLAQAFTALNHTSKTLSVYKELAKLHAERDQHAEARDAWGKIERLDPSDAGPPGVEGEPARAAARGPGARARPRPGPDVDVPGHRRGRRLRRRLRRLRRPAGRTVTLSREQIQKLLTETDVYVKYGLHDKALEHLRRIFAVDPENLDAHEKAYVIYRSAGQAAQATEQLLNVLRLCTRGLERKRAQPYLDTLLSEAPGHPEMPAFLSVLRPEAVRGGADPALTGRRGRGGGAPRRRRAGRRPPTTWPSGAPARAATTSCSPRTTRRCWSTTTPEPSPLRGGDEPLTRRARRRAAPRCSSRLRPRWTGTATPCRTGTSPPSAPS